MPPQTKPRCLTAEQAGDLADTFSPRFGGVNTTCQRTEYSKTDQKLTWRLECRGQFNMDSAAEFTFFSPIRYTAVILSLSVAPLHADRERGRYEGHPDSNRVLAFSDLRRGV